MLTWKKVHEKLFTTAHLPLTLLFLFIIMNWVLLCLTEKLGPPDFYKLYWVAENLYGGNLEVGIIPPLFPLILYPLGKLACLFTNPETAFIFTGRFIALTATLGVTWFTYKLLEQFTGKYAMIFVSLMAICPWFLKMSSFPITDMLYLCFLTAAFYYFSKGSTAWKLALTFSITAALTRFEGLLLFLSGTISLLKGKLKKRNLLILLGAASIAILVIIFFLLFTPRFFAHFRDIIIPRKSYLFIFLHPLDFLNVIYGNFLYMIPFNFPLWAKWSLFAAVLACFTYGVYHLFKIKRGLTLGLLTYQLLFFIAKGYIDVYAPEREFRRVLSGLWIFFLFAFIGCTFLLKTLKKNKTSQYLTLGITSLIIITIMINMPMGPWINFLPALLLLPPFLYPLLTLKLKPTIKYGFITLLLAFTCQCYLFSLARTGEYIDSYANKTAYAAAQWFIQRPLPPGTRVLSYTDNLMMDYYLKNTQAELDKKQIERIHYVLPLDLTGETRDHFIKAFMGELDRFNVNYIIFDNYVVQKPEFRRINEIKRILFEERNNQQYFRLRLLYYKGQNVGYVLKVVYSNANGNIKTL